MLLWIQIGSAIAGLVAAALWFWSATAKAPQAIFDGGVRMQSFLNSAARRNRWAAGITAISALFSVAGTLLSAMGGK